jgi:hypothetical protein
MAEANQERQVSYSLDLLNIDYGLLEKSPETHTWIRPHLYPSNG